MKPLSDHFDAAHEGCGCSWMMPATWVMCPEHYAQLEADLAAEPQPVPALVRLLAQANRITATDDDAPAGGMGEDR